MINPYDCSTCGNEDCSGCAEYAFESGYKAALQEVGEWLEGKVIAGFITAYPYSIREVIESLKKGEMPD